MSDRQVVLVAQRGRFLVGEPFFERGRRVTIESHREARPGKLALVDLAGGRKGRTKVLRVLGDADNATDVLEALMLDRGLDRRFPPGVERAATESVERVRESPSRQDVRDLPTFTIDPVTAKDFDDAISAEELPGGLRRIRVHIADVSAFVKPGSPVDREAYLRATSVYVPGKVEPMLPEVLSNGACSLVPDQDRFAVTVVMDFDGPDVVKSAFHRSLIRSDARLDYDQVDRIFAGDEPWAEPWAEPLRVAREVAAALEERRRARGALAIESAEPEFAFDRRGHVTGSQDSVQTESHRLIEHLMIAANEQVAELLAARELPALYRVHERPDPTAVDRLLGQLESLGVPTPPAPEADAMTSEQAAKIVSEASFLVEQHVRRTGRGRAGLTSLVLRSLKQAHYTPHNKGHAGLGSPRYCHFTSPIRRYPDLVCHRALLNAVAAEEDSPRTTVLEEAGTWCSSRERDAMQIERAADAVTRCFLLERRLFEQGWDTVFSGEVTGVIGAGAFVAFGDGQEGLLPVRRLEGDWWELNDEGTILLGTRTDRRITIGDPVQVVVERVDAPRGRVDLLPVDGRTD